MYHLGECIRIKEEDRNILHNQMIELIIVLFRNLLRVAAEENDLKNDQFRLMEIMSQ